MMINIPRKIPNSDGRTWTLETWIADPDKPCNLMYLSSAIERGLDPFRVCAGGQPHRASACDHYPIIGESQCPACKKGVCGLCNRDVPTPPPHGRIVCNECSSSLRRTYPAEGLL